MFPRTCALQTPCPSPSLNLCSARNSVAIGPRQYRRPHSLFQEILIWSFSALKATLEVTFVNNFASCKSSLLWFAIAESSLLSLEKLLDPCGGMPKLLALKDVTFINSRSRLLTAGESLLLVAFSASPCWLTLSPPQVGVPELLAPYWENLPFSALENPWKVFAHSEVYVSGPRSLTCLLEYKTHG